jgi:TIR domain
MYVRDNWKMVEQEPLKVFYSYARKDDSYRENLNNHLIGLIRQKFIETWCDLRINPGEDWRSQIIDRIETADIILFLISSDFIASDYCYSTEMTRAIKRHKEGKASVIPIYIRPVYIPGLPFEKLQSLPSDAKPVASWASHDEAWVSVVEGIHRVIDEINVKRDLEFSIAQSNNNSSKQDFSRFSDTSVSITKFHQNIAFQQNESSKIIQQPKITESVIDKRARRLKSIANTRDISREDADAAIEETKSWLAVHESDTNIRQIYLSLVGKKGTPEQVEQALISIESWLKKYPNNTNVRTQYIILITEKTSLQKAKLVIKETENWINQNKKKDESVLIAYLGLVEKWGTIEQFQQAVNNVEDWCPTSSQRKGLKDKLLKLRKMIEEVESDKHRQSTFGSLKMVQFNIDTLAHYLSHLAVEGTLKECQAAIEDTRYWLKNEHPEDTNIRQVYLKLVGKEGIADALVQRALEETENWLKRHDSNTSVRQAYLRLVRNRGTLIQQKKALNNTEVWLQHYDSAHIREAYHILLQAIKKMQC